MGRLEPAPAAPAPPAVVGTWLVANEPAALKVGPEPGDGQWWSNTDQDLIDRLPVGKDIDKGPFSRPNPMQRYMNFRVWWEEPRNLLYVTPGVQVLYNLDDQSFSVSPDISYTGYENLELRLRATVPVGDTLTEWGEKPNQYKIELRARYYF